MTIVLRPPTLADVPACGDIIYAAFRSISAEHHFPPDIPSPEMAAGLARSLIDHPAFFGVVAESDGQVIGSNFLDERDAVRGVGPITVDPGRQSRSVGRRLMEAVIERGRGAPAIRLVQDAFNITSMPLYASLGFEVKEPLVVMRGKPLSKPADMVGVEVRTLREDDLEGCAALCRAVHRFDRNNELRDVMKRHHSFTLLRDGRVAAYTSAPTFWLLNHAVAETEQDMKDLLMGVAASSNEPLSFLLPTRQASLFRWCLGQGLRVIKPMTLMAMGEYQEPKGCFFPSVSY